MGKQDYGVACDTMLSQVGEFGPYQKRLMLVVLLASASGSVHMLSTIFIMAVPDFRCAVPDLLNDTFDIQNEAHATLVNASIPFDPKDGGYSQCYHYSSRLNQSTLQTNASTERDSCSRWVYSTDVFGSSIVADFNLVCDRRIVISNINMMTMAGLMLGSIAGGPSSDIWGRRKSFLLFSWLHLALSIMTIFVTSENVFLFLRLFVMAVYLGGYMTIYVLCMEITAPRMRVWGPLFNLYGFGSGYLLLTLAAYLVRDWRTLQIVLCCPLLLLAVLYFWLIPESPRWLLNKGRHSEALAVLADIARVNKRTLPANVNFQAEGADGGALIEKDAPPESSTRPAAATSGIGSLLLLSKSPTLILRLIILSFCWAVLSMVYYGLTMNVGSIIEGNLYTNVMVLGLLDLLAFTLTMLFLHRRGRKVLFCGCILLGGTACLSTIFPIFYEDAPAWVNAALSNLGRFFISSAFSAAWLFTTELLPTPVRQSGIGLCSFVGRVGGIVSPYIATLPTAAVGGSLGKAIPLVVFGAAAVASGLLSLLLPETANRKLPETVEEAENLKSPKTKGDKSTIVKPRGQQAEFRL